MRWISWDTKSVYKSLWLTPYVLVVWTWDELHKGLESISVGEAWGEGATWWEWSD